MKIVRTGYNYRHGAEFKINRPTGSGDYLLLIIRSDAFAVINGEKKLISPNSALIYNKGTPQLYGAAGEFLLFAALVWLARRGVGGRRLLGVYLTAYAVGRFALEFWRGDEYRGVYAGLSLSQWISLVTAALGLWLLLRKVKREASP